MISGKILEKILKDNLNDFFSPQGFEYFHYYENTYFWKMEGNIQYRLEIQAKSFSIGEYCELSIAFWDIEDILIDIALPHRTKEELLENRRFNRTVIDNNLKPKLIENGLVRAETIEECQELCKNIMKYINNEGKLFFEKYTYLPNILEEINTLIKEGKYWHQGIIKLGQSYFTGLIISRLCNDPNFEGKYEYVKELYSAPENNLTAYIPYLEKLNERLKTVVPIYNV